MTMALGCTAWRIGSTLQEYQGQVLRVRDQGPGAPRLATESDYDPALRHFLQQNGSPDYLYVVDRYTLQVVYLSDDRVVLFQRPLFSPKSSATVTDGIPDGLMKLLTREDQERLARVRASRSPAATPPSAGPWRALSADRP